MAETPAVEMKRTVVLTGQTMNAMALIAPGAFLIYEVNEHSHFVAVDKFK